MKQIGFIASETGAVVKYNAQAPAQSVENKPKALTKYQRSTLYFKALRYAEALLREVGFTAITESSHGAFSVELGNFLLEMRVQESPRVAHVTSFEGYQYDPEKINAKVTMLMPVEKGEFVIRVIATLPNFKTCEPMYIVVPKDSANPLQEAFSNIVRAAHFFISKDPSTLNKIGEAIKKRDLAEDLKRLAGAESVPQVPDASTGGLTEGAC